MSNDYRTSNIWLQISHTHSRQSNSMKGPFDSLLGLNGQQKRHSNRPRSLEYWWNKASSDRWKLHYYEIGSVGSTLSVIPLNQISNGLSFAGECTRLVCLLTDKPGNVIAGDWLCIALDEIHVDIRTWCDCRWSLNLWSRDPVIRIPVSHDLDIIGLFASLARYLNKHRFPWFSIGHLLITLEKRYLQNIFEER